MKFYLYCLMCSCLFLAANTAWAQLFSDTPLCFTVRNQSGYQIFASVETDIYTDPQGVRHYHRTNIRLEDGEFQQGCATGPFFSQYYLHFRLQGLIPLWQCRFPANSELLVTSSRDADGSARLEVNCPRLRG